MCIYTVHKSSLGLKLTQTCLFCTCCSSLFCSNNSFCTSSSCFLLCFSIRCPRLAPSFPLRAASCCSLALSRLFSRPSSSALCAASSYNGEKSVYYTGRAEPWWGCKQTKKSDIICLENGWCMGLVGCT